MDVNTVIITHVHDDHSGGAVTGTGEPAFPSARYVLQRTDHDWLRDEAGKSEEDAAIWETLMAPLVSRGALDLVDGEAEIASGVSVRLAPGHTPGHQIIRVASESRRLIISGDAFNHPAQLSYPDWPSGSDVLHAEAATSRRTIIAELGSHGGSVLAPNHFGEPFGKMIFGPDHLAGWRPL
jgi:glyoxylase-like metal-dependent hydrolase (beta-lactamase superfamily II)